jgi:toxin ParE1/3/4
VHIAWSQDARHDLWQILDFIGDKNTVAAFNLFHDIESATTNLAQNPYLYKLGRVTGTREIIVHPNYIVVYRVLDNIEILNVLHARQQYP